MAHRAETTLHLACVVAHVDHRADLCGFDLGETAAKMERDVTTFFPFTGCRVAHAEKNQPRLVAEKDVGYGADLRSD